MKTEDLIIEGMGCGHCIVDVMRELGNLAGVQVEFVERGKARVQYDGSRISHLDLELAVGNAGYRLVAYSNVTA